MPVPARLATSISVLSATLLVGGVCAGSAVALPNDQDEPDSSVASKGLFFGRNLGSLTPGRESTSTVHDRLRLPRSPLGSVREPRRSSGSFINTHDVPRTRTQSETGSEELLPDAPPPEGMQEEPRGDEQTAVVDQKASSTSSAGVRLPTKTEVSAPIATMPGTPATAYSVDLTNPVSAYSTSRGTYETANSLVTDAVQPYNPLDDLKPKPQPQPAMRVYETQELGPAIVDVDGSGSGPVVAGMTDLSVVQIPLVVPAAMRLAPPRPLSETAAAPTGSAGGNGAPAARGSESLTGAQGATPPLNGASSPSVNSSLRQGFPQYLRNARPVELAAVALPGVAGLLAITFGGGVLGYRQANSGRYLRSDSARFLT